MCLGDCLSERGLRLKVRMDQQPGCATACANQSQIGNLTDLAIEQTLPRPLCRSRQGEFVMRKPIAAVAAVLILTGCSSRPREFSPVLATASADAAGLEAVLAECRSLLAEGKLTSDGRLASGAVGAAAGATTLAVGSAAASGMGLYSGMAVAGATLVALPFVALGGAYGMAKARQKKKEKAIQTAIGGCLAQRGFEVGGWQRKGKVLPVTKAAQPPR